VSVSLVVVDTGFWIASNGYISGPQGQTQFWVSSNGVVNGPSGQTSWRFLGDLLTENGNQSNFRRQSGRIIGQVGGELPSFLR